MRDQGDSSAGFTLIEVLIALVILAIASGFAFSAISDSFGRLSQADWEQQAVTVAETMMDRLGRDLPIQSGHMTGTEGRMHWTVDIGAALTDPPPASGLAAYPARVLVERRDSKIVRQFRFESVRLGPEPGPQ